MLLPNIRLALQIGEGSPGILREDPHLEREGRDYPLLDTLRILLRRILEIQEEGVPHAHNHGDAPQGRQIVQDTHYIHTLDLERRLRTSLSGQVPPRRQCYLQLEVRGVPWGIREDEVPSGRAVVLRLPY